MRHLTTTALLVALLCAPFMANAWWVKVRNPAEEKIYVTLYYGLVFPPPSVVLYAWIEPGSTHTFNTGGDCPRGLSGHTNNELRDEKLMDTDMHGTWYHGLAANLALPSCANFNIKICDMPKGSKEHYSFCIDR